MLTLSQRQANSRRQAVETRQIIRKVTSGTGLPPLTRQLGELPKLSGIVTAVAHEGFVSGFGVCIEGTGVSEEIVRQAHIAVAERSQMPALSAVSAALTHERVVPAVRI